LNDEKKTEEDQKVGDKKVKIEIVETVENVLLDRKEISFIVSHLGLSVPSKSEVKDLLIKSLKIPSDSAVTISIFPRFGSNRSRGVAKIYPSKEVMVRVEGG